MVQKIVAILGLIIIVLAVIFFGRTRSVIALVTYQCNEGKTIGVTFYSGETKGARGSATVSLSDGRKFDLPQTISADGGRYANSDESFVFWSKGNGALVLENNQEKSYIGCILVANDPGGLSQVYESGEQGFSIRYPEGYTIGRTDNGGIKFTIPETMATGTNLSSDSYLSVEELPQTPNCSAALFLDMGAKVSTTTDNGVEYSVATSTGAAAGNRYEETVYAIPGTNPCVAVHYLVHYGVLENYPTGAVREFDRQLLVDQFDQIRRTLVVNQ